jgi:hypothetical protein
LEGPEFFDRPWPSDERLLNGRVDMYGFPHQGETSLLTAYVEAATGLEGWATNGPIFVRFDGPIDVGLLPSAEDSRRGDSPVLLLDVDPHSPNRGAALPLEFSWTEEHTWFQPDDFLAIHPVWGFPLRPATQYALVLRSPLVRAGAMPEGWEALPGWEPMLDVLRARGVEAEDVAAAVRFTTQDPIAEMRRMARALDGEIGHPALDADVTWVDQRDGYDLYVGEVVVPVWQHGERPYREQGGEFRFDESGAPVLASWERVGYSLTVPSRVDQPQGGWPLVLYSHGTGGDQFSFCGGYPDDEGSVMARQGVAMFGISQPLHGDRATPDTSAELDSFNFSNPDAGRTNFRQGALDQVYLARLLTESPLTFLGDDGARIPIDASSVAYFGHSQGGLVGALAGPWMSRFIVAQGFSGTGGGLSLTLELRKDPFDIAQVMGDLLAFDEGETADPFHPVVAMVQMLVEVTDPVNYAPYWFAEQGDGAARPVPTLLTEGLLDAATPSLATEALAAAGRAPLVGEPATDPLGLALRGIEGVDLPSSLDAVDWAGEPITAGLAQFADDDHYAIYDNEDAKRLYRDFLESAVEEHAPELDE